MELKLLLDGEFCEFFYVVQIAFSPMILIRSGKTFRIILFTALGLSPIIATFFFRLVRPPERCFIAWRRLSHEIGIMSRHSSSHYMFLPLLLWLRIDFHFLSDQIISAQNCPSSDDFNSVIRRIFDVILANMLRNEYSVLCILSCCIQFHKRDVHHRTTSCLS